MDDLAVMLVADSSLHLLDRLASVASDCGFEQNLAGETEAVVSWVGLGSRPLRRRLAALYSSLPAWERTANCGFRLWVQMTQLCGLCPVTGARQCGTGCDTRVCLAPLWK